MAVRGALGSARRAARLAGVAAHAAVAPGALPGAAGNVARALGRPAVPSALNRPLSAHRVLGETEVDLAATRQLARETGVKVNDVVLAAASMALSRWSQRRGVPSRRLKAMVPVNVRGDGDGPLGNRISFLFVELPPGVGSALDVLAAVHDRTRRGKEASHPGLVDAALDVLGGLPGPARGVAAKLMARPEAFNLVVSNVPGPDVPLYALGRRLRTIHPAVPLAERHGLSIGVLSYAGRLHAGLYADPATVGDVDDLAEDLATAFRALLTTVEHARETPAPRPSRPEPDRLAAR
jgi:WS/DGAT/MGAT family acyltransferase